MTLLHPSPMNGILARVSALLYKSTIFHTNFVGAVANASTGIPFMGGGCMSRFVLALRLTRHPVACSFVAKGSEGRKSLLKASRPEFMYQSHIASLIFTLSF